MYDSFFPSNGTHIDSWHYCEKMLKCILFGLLSMRTYKALLARPPHISVQLYCCNEPKGPLLWKGLHNVPNENVNVHEFKSFDLVIWRPLYGSEYPMYFYWMKPVLILHQSQSNSTVVGPSTTNWPLNLAYGNGRFSPDRLPVTWKPGYTNPWFVYFLVNSSGYSQNIFISFYFLPCYTYIFWIVIITPDILYLIFGL